MTPYHSNSSNTSSSLSVATAPQPIDGSDADVRPQSVFVNARQYQEQEPKRTPKKPPFRSARVVKGEVDRPWLHKKDPREKWLTLIPLIGMALGLGVAGFLVWDGVRQVVNHRYCVVLDEDFSNGLDERVWTKEVELGGFGNGQFEQTTSSSENAFIRNGELWIQPSLQDAWLITSNSTIDLRADGTCTSGQWSDCLATTNTTNGTIVNPVRSARLHTRRGATLRYGRLEVTARLPAGDWLWPAIWLLPVREAYGAWPRSGEIDVAESRGNAYTYPRGGNDVVSSALHWGPDPAHDRWWMHVRRRPALHSTFHHAFHTFGLEWSEDYLFTYIDSRLQHVLYARFDVPFWSRGRFPPSVRNGSQVIVDPWSATGRKQTPFDQPFYLILNVAVGGTNGWFEDGAADKPWFDESPAASKEFWMARDRWWPTWKQGGQMRIRSVKMWQQEGYEGCVNGEKIRP